MCRPDYPGNPQCLIDSSEHMRDAITPGDEQANDSDRCQQEQHGRIQFCLRHPLRHVDDYAERPQRLQAAGQVSRLRLD